MSARKFKVGDKVMIKTKGWYAYGEKLSVDRIFSNGDLRLLIHKKNGEPTDDLNTIERYSPEDLKRGWKK